MKADKEITAHLLACFCIVVWGGAMVSAKRLLEIISPQELLFWRFFLGYLTLWILLPKKMKLKEKKHEFYCILCGITGVTLYFLCQNMALTMTQASSISVIVSISPMFTAVINKLVNKKEKLVNTFILGFFVSIIGIVLVGFNGVYVWKPDILGDVLALVSAFVWAVYSVLIKKLEQYPPLIITRKCFFYGLISMLPVLAVTGFDTEKITQLVRFPAILHLIFMGCAASALCYGIWNKAFYILGVVKTNAYLYALPIVTIVFSTMFLQERISSSAVVGVLFTISGLLLSQLKFLKRIHT